MSTPTQERLLYRLKTHGPMTAQQLAEMLDLTSMGARQQLETAEEAGLVQHTDRHSGKGRPKRWWSLTSAGHARFPDRHGDVVIELLNQVRQQFGAEGMEQLITAREIQMRELYGKELSLHDTLESKLRALTEVRTREGYMAEIRKVEDFWELVEHHCPICAAATQCQAFCRSELKLFSSLLPEATLQRSEHLLSGGARCVYRIVPIAIEGAGQKKRGKTRSAQEGEAAPIGKPSA